MQSCRLCYCLTASQSGCQYLRRDGDNRRNAEETVALIATMYNRSVSSGSQVIPYLEYLQTERLPANPQIWESTVELFKLHFRRYITGIGHPSHPNLVEFISEDVIKDGEGDKSLRARLFLLSISGSQLLPLHKKALKVCNNCHYYIVLFPLRLLQITLEPSGTLHAVSLQKSNLLLLLTISFGCS
jgi:hypothetical protein